ncbi:hypothetical protein EBU71_17795 [bacterium]|nr:hypothetical protein [Candidatus Elulimicrobium humile]
MRYEHDRLKMKEVVSGLGERDVNSKALLNNDYDSLLKYRIQRRRNSQQGNEIELVRNEVVQLKSELQEIKELLLTITKSKE